MYSMLGFISLLFPIITSIICAIKITNDKLKSKKLKWKPLVSVIFLFLVFYGVYILTIFVRNFVLDIPTTGNDSYICMNPHSWCKNEFITKEQELLFNRAILFKYLYSFYASLFSSFIVLTYSFCKNKIVRRILYILETILLIVLIILFIYYIKQIIN